MRITKLRKTLKKTVQEEEYEPVVSEVMGEAELEPGDNVREAGDKLYDVVSLEVKKDLLKRAAEQDMDEELIDIIMDQEPVVVEDEIVNEEVDN